VRVIELALRTDLNKVKEKYNSKKKISVKWKYMWSPTK